MLLRMLEEGRQVDEIIYCNIMATSNIGGEYPEMYEYINKINKYIKQNYNKEIKILVQKKSFEDYFYITKKTGKNKGKIYGYPYTIRSWCNERLKLKVFNEYYKTLKEEYTTYIGIAYDEPKRLAKLEKNEKAPLAEWKMTEADCLQYTKEKGLYNPLYDKFKRLGCWFCVKQGLDSLRILRQDYPEFWKILLKWQEDSEVPFKPDYTVQQLAEKFKGERRN